MGWIGETPLGFLEVGARGCSDDTGAGSSRAGCLSSAFPPITPGSELFERAPPAAGHSLEARVCSAAKSVRTFPANAFIEPDSSAPSKLKSRTSLVED